MIASSVAVATPVPLRRPRATSTSLRMFAAIGRRGDAAVSTALPLDAEIKMDPLRRMRMRRLTSRSAMPLHPLQPRKYRARSNRHLLSLLKKRKKNKTRRRKMEARPPRILITRMRL